jgi:hypothetical protein
MELPVLPEQCQRTSAQYRETGLLTVLEVNEVDREARSAKEDWEIAESALKKAVERFAEMMRIT